MNTAASVEMVLNPLLTSKGFAAGQDGGNSADESTDIIWCGAHDELEHRYPWLPQVTGRDELNGDVCFDLTITLSLGEIVRVDLEGRSLDEVFLLTGQPLRAQQATELIGTPARTSTQQLASLLASIFSA